MTAREASARASSACGDAEGATDPVTSTCGGPAGGTGGTAFTGDGVRAIGTVAGPVPGAGADVTFGGGESGVTTDTMAGAGPRPALRCIAARVHGSDSNATARAHSDCATGRWPSSAYAVPRLKTAFA